MYRVVTAALSFLLLSPSPPLLVFAVVDSAAPDPCGDGTFAFEGTGEEHAFTKLSVLGYSTSYAYVPLPAGRTEPFLKVLRATEPPSVQDDGNGALTIAPENYSCEAAPPAATAPPTSSTDSETSSAPATAARWTTMAGLFGFLAKPSSIAGGPVLLLQLLLAAAFFVATPCTGVLAEGAASSCTPKLEIEISVPAGASAAEKFGKGPLMC